MKQKAHSTMNDESDTSESLALPESPQAAANTIWALRGSFWGLFTTFELAWHWKPVYLLLHAAPTAQKAADRAGTWFLDQGLRALALGVICAAGAQVLLDLLRLGPAWINSKVRAKIRDWDDDAHHQTLRVRYQQLLEDRRLWEEQLNVAIRQATQAMEQAHANELTRQGREQQAANESLTAESRQHQETTRISEDNRKKAEETNRNVASIEGAH